MIDETGRAAALAHGPRWSGPTELSPDLPGLLRAQAPDVVVLGDAVLDEWLTGPSSRLSREAPVPVVDVEDTRSDPGGAAHVAVCLAALGARVRLVSAVGDDADGERLRTLLAEAGVDVSGLVREPGMRTATKRRVAVADGTLVARFDTTDTGPAQRGALLAAAESHLARLPDAVLVCDHGLGSAAALREQLAAGRDELGLVVVDAHDLAPWAPLRPDLATPNLGEAERLLGPLRTARDDEGGGRDVVDALERSAADLRRGTGAGTVVVTLDRHGSVLVPAPGEGPVHRTWAEPGAELAACGAGDVFTAALTLARSVGLAERIAVELAQVAADVVVHRDSTAPCTTADLVAALSRVSPTILDHDELARIATQVRERGGRLVFTNGCFDVLHAGHVASLNQAKRLGDVLVVALNDDASVARLKGPGRPVNSVADRAAVVGALSCVDHVTSFGDDTPTTLLRRLRPDVYAKGGDYTAQTLPETEVVRSWGGDVHLLDYVADHSTTAILERADAGRAEVPR